MREVQEDANNEDSAIAFTVLASLVGITRLEGQTMDEERLLKEFVALTPNEVSGLDVSRKGVSRQLLCACHCHAEPSGGATWRRGQGFSSFLGACGK